MAKGSLRLFSISLHVKMLVFSKPENVPRDCTSLLTFLWKGNPGASVDLAKPNSTCQLMANSCCKFSRRHLSKPLGGWAPGVAYLVQSPHAFVAAAAAQRVASGKWRFYAFGRPQKSLAAPFVWRSCANTPHSEKKRCRPQSCSWWLFAWHFGISFFSHSVGWALSCFHFPFFYTDCLLLGFSSRFSAGVNRGCFVVDFVLQLLVAEKGCSRVGGAAKANER